MRLNPESNAIFEITNPKNSNFDTFFDFMKEKLMLPIRKAKKSATQETLVSILCYSTF